MTSATETALNRVHFNEYGDCLDRPYVVRALKSIDVNKLDEDGCFVDGETFHVVGGSTWEVRGPSWTGSDVHLDGDDGYLELNWGDLALFELIEEGGYDE